MLYNSPVVVNPRPLQFGLARRCVRAPGIAFVGRLKESREMRRTGIAGLTVLIGVVRAYGAAPMTSYHVGNSLTWDANPPTIAQIAAVAGQTLSAGYHIDCGQNLTYMVGNPTEVCVTPTAYG